jgi:hypothetical protein
MANREVRFGVGANGGPGHRYWAVRTSASRPEAYVRGNRTGAFFGASLHEDPEHWHWKSHRPRQAPSYGRWKRPGATYAGCTRALEIVVHELVATVGPPATSRKPIAWYWPKARNVQVCFDLFLEPAGVDPASWPGRNSMSTELLGRCDMSDGSTLAVVGWEQEHVEQRVTLPMSDEAKAEMLRSVETANTPWMILMGLGEDGTAWWREGPLEVRT